MNKGMRIPIKQLNTMLPDIGKRPLYKRLGFSKDDYPLPNDYWAQPKGEKYIIAIYVFTRLLEIPEALSELNERRLAFMDSFGPIIKPWYDAELDDAVRGTKRKGSYNPLLTADTLKRTFPLNDSQIVFFEPWAKKWAASSKPIATLCFADSVIYVTAALTGKSYKEIRRQQAKAMRFIADTHLENDELGWAWKVLLSGEYSRAQKTTRGLARQSLRAHSYNWHREATLAKWVDYWIRTHVLGETVTMIQRQLEREILNVPEPGNISLAFKSIDDALEIERKRGAPLGKPRFIMKNLF